MPDNDLDTLYGHLLEQHAAACIADAAERAAYQTMICSEAGLEWNRRKAEQENAHFHEKEADSGLRLAAVALYESSGEKHPHPNVAIRVNLTMERETDEQALEWAAEHPDIPALIIPAAPNWKQIEKYARAVREIAPLPFVRWRELPVVAISLDEE